MKNIFQVVSLLLALCLMSFAYALDNVDHSPSEKNSLNQSGASQIVKDKLDSRAQPQSAVGTEEEEE